jgi:hypothetical protein
MERQKIRIVIQLRHFNEHLIEVRKKWPADEEFLIAQFEYSDSEAIYPAPHQHQERNKQ